MKNKKTSLQRLFPVYVLVSPQRTEHNGKRKRNFQNRWVADYRCFRH